MNMCLSKWHGQSNLKRPFSVLSPMLLLQEVTPEVLLDGRGLRQVRTSIFFFPTVYLLLPSRYVRVTSPSETMQR